MTNPSARAAPLKKATIERGGFAAAQVDVAEITAAKLRGELVEAAEVEATVGRCVADGARRDAGGAEPSLCTENLIRVDDVMESPWSA